MSRPGMRLVATLGSIALVLIVAVGESLAARAWVKDEVRLNIRTGPGTRYRILGGLQTGDVIDVLSQGDGWTQIRGRDGVEGWIPEGYLQAEPPARIRLERQEAESKDLRERFAKLSAEVEELRTRATSLDATRSEHEAEIARLTRENLELHAGARWPEWFAGAAILFVGAILGMIVHRSTTRRPGSRIRL